MITRALSFHPYQVSARAAQRQEVSEYGWLFDFGHLGEASGCAGKDCVEGNLPDGCAFVAARFRNSGYVLALVMFGRC